MGFSWDLANEQAETLKEEITVSVPEALQLVSKILRIPSSRGQYAKQMQYKVQHLNQMIDQQVWGALSVQGNLLLLILCFIPRCYQKILPPLPLYQLIS